MAPSRWFQPSSPANSKMKNFFLAIALSLQLAALAPAAAALGTDYHEMLEQLQEDVAEQSVDVQEDAEGIELPTFSDEGEGASSIVAAIQRALDFFKLVLTPLAVLFMTIMGVRMVTASKDNEEVMTASKNYIVYALQGMILIFVADSLVSVFFGGEGEVFRNGESGAQEQAREVSQLFAGMYGLVEVLIGAVAVFMLVTAGMRYVAGSASDDQIGKAKKQITWALVGLFVIGIAEFVVKDILFKNRGTTLGVNEAKELFVNLTNFIAGTMGTLSFVFLLYAGYLYVLGSANEDNVAKSKKIMMGAAIGIVLALAAFAIVNTVVELDASR